VRTLLPILLAAGLVSFTTVEAAGPAAPDNTAASTAGTSADTSGPLAEVTVTAQHSNLDWWQRNELVQKAATYVYGIAVVGGLKDRMPRWTAPICPLVTGLPRGKGEFVRGRVLDIARSSSMALGDEHCHPNLIIFVTTQPTELLRAMENRHFGVSFGNATPSSVEQFINRPAPVKVWHNTFQGTFGDVYVVADQTQLRVRGVSQ